jgi:GDP-mannose pyrophosphatase NudK
MTSSPRIVDRRPVYKGWNSFEIVTVAAVGPDGETRRLDREVIDHGEAAVVLIVDRERETAVLVRQWRAPLLDIGEDPFLLEVCAGIVDPGETPEEAARREAHEESGITLGAMRKVGAILPSAGTLTEKMHLFIAEIDASARGTPNGGNAHEGEDIEVVEVPLHELFAMARAGTIRDAKTLALVQHLLIERLEAGA